MRLAYVVGRFPEPSETFIAREVEGMKRQGACVDVFSVWRSLCQAETPGDPRGKRFPEPTLPNFHLHIGIPVWLLVDAFQHVWAALKRAGTTLDWSAYFTAAVARERYAALRAVRNLPAALDLASRLRRQPVDRVHAQFANVPSTVAWVAAVETRLPFSFAVHARDVFVEPHFLARKAQAADHVIACNSAAANRVRELVRPADRDKITLVPHGVPLDQFTFRREAAAGDPLILGVGRFVEKKGFPFLLRAVAQLREEGRKVACWLVGDGPQRPYLATGVEKLGLGDTVTFKNWLPQDELITAYERAAALVVPSIVAKDGDRDGLPNVVVEAAAKGLPIVATDVGGIGDLVRDGETGLIAREGDSADLAAKIAAVLTDPEGARERTRRARREVEARFDQEQCIRRLMEVLGAGSPANRE